MMKKFVFGLCTIMLGFFFYPLSSEATENYAYLPDETIRANIVSSLHNLENPILVTNELPTINDMLLLKDMISGNPNRSLEGIEYAKNIEELNINPTHAIYDYRPIAELKKLKSYYSYNSLGGDTGDNIVINIQPFSQLENLESLNLGAANVTDLTPLENMKNLKFYNSMGSGIKLPKEYISKENKTFIIESPVKYSSQFTNIAVQAFSKEGYLNCELIDGAVIIKNLNVDTQEIHLTMQGKSDSFNWSEGFSSTMNFTIPVSWY